MEINRRSQKLFAAALGSPGAREDLERAPVLTPIMPDEAARMRRFFRDVSAERGRQLDKWGEQHHDDGTSLKNDGWRDHARSLCQRAAAEGRVTWAHILQEEFTEAMAEVEPDRLRAEVIQVAAVCAAWVSDIDQRAETDAADRAEMGEA